MDKVRFGRALGYGARHAAKTVMQAVDAATTANPRSAAGPGSPGTAARGTVARGTAAGRGDSVAARTVRNVPAVVAQTRTAGARAAGSFTGPLRRVSSVIFLQVTGSFFGLLAAIFGAAAWRQSGGWHAGLHLPAGRGDAVRLGLLAGLTVMFAYFSLANFVRARRRERQRT